MTPSMFVDELHRSVVASNMAAYRDMFASTSGVEITDPYSRRAAALFGALSDDQRSVFFEVLNQVAIDTVSNILGIVDGSSYFPGNPKFALTANDGALSGDLQDLFLSTAEENHRV